jgi:hypothetical protein
LSRCRWFSAAAGDRRIQGKVAGPLPPVQLALRLVVQAVVVRRVPPPEVLPVVRLPAVALRRREAVRVLDPPMAAHRAARRAVRVAVDRRHQAEPVRQQVMVDALARRPADVRKVRGVVARLVPPVAPLVSWRPDV